MAGPEEVVREAEELGVSVNLFSNLGSVRTVSEVASQMERPESEVGVSVLVTVRGDPLLVLATGDRRVDGDRIAAHHGVRPSDVALATAGEAQEITGYANGTIPPFALDHDTPILLDNHALDHEHLLFPAGGPGALIELEPAALARLDRVLVGDWTTAKGEDDLS